MSNIINLLSTVLSNNKPTVQKSSAVRSVSNPFANPFVTPNTTSSYSQESYAKNTPVRGGYYAGYYNGEPNIVGRKLFIEV